MSIELTVWHSAAIPPSVPKSKGLSRMNEASLTTVEKLYKGLQLTGPLLRKITARVGAEMSGTGISVGQRVLLEVLIAATQATAPEITKASQMKRQYVARELKELLQNGMVFTKPNPQHKTSHFYCVTDNARGIIQSISEREAKKFAEFTRQFKPEDIDAFYRVQLALDKEMARK